MAWFDWLRQLFQPKAKPLTRDVSRLESKDVQVVTEVVDTSGKPLKEGHRRRTPRDPRLLPKPKPTRYVYPPPARKKYFTQEDAARLFSGSLRTRDRQVRDLLVDEEQLQRYGLPLWRTEEELAAALGVSVRMLRHYSVHRERERVRHYVTFALPKRTGGQRLIMAPKRQLKALQRIILRELIAKLPVSPHAHGFRTGRSVASGAAPHVGKQVLLHLDLKDFFPTVHVGRVRGMLIALGYSYPVAAALAVLMTEAERQPVDIEGQLFHVPVGVRHCVQGAPTSPGVCNTVALRLDRRLAGLARKFGFAYTRYADDLTFSGDDPACIRRLRRWAERIIREEGFAPNRKKSRVMRRSQRQSVTGVIVNQQLGLNRHARRKLRAAVHQLKQQGTPDAARLRQVRGKLAYLAMLNPDQARPLLAQLPGE